MTTRNKIKLKIYESPNLESVYTIEKKHFKVRLYFGHKKLFTNKKEVQKYLSQTSNFIDDVLSELNYLLSDIYVSYRDNWAYIPNSDDRNKLDLKFHSCGQLLNMFDRNEGLMQNFNAFDKFFKSVNVLQEVLLILKDTEKLRYNAKPYKIESLINRVIFLDDQVKDYLKH